MMKQIPNLARMRAFNGDYTVFTTTTGEQGIADRQGNVIPCSPVVVVNTV